jgi:uncharacterized repeat protein (TIGR04138 family)
MIVFKRSRADADGRASLRAAGDQIARGRPLGMNRRAGSIGATAEASESMDLKAALEAIGFQTMRYSEDAYVFVLDALELARSEREQSLKSIATPSESEARAILHVKGAELCDAARRLAHNRFGPLGGEVLGRWGVRSTSDIGEIVYQLISLGVLEKTEDDRREDFDGVFDFAPALRDEYRLRLDQVRWMEADHG